MSYKFPVPGSRGFKAQKEFTPQVLADTSTSVNGFIFHSLISRVTYDDNSTEEYRPIYDGETIELDIDQDKLDSLTSKITLGPKLNQWRWWLFGYNQYLNTYNDVVFNNIYPYSNSSDLGSIIDPWDNIYSNTIHNSGDVYVGGNLTANGIVNFNNMTDSTSTATGSLVVDGGVGISKTLNIGQQLFVHNLEHNSNISLKMVSYNPSTGNLSYGAEATMVLSASANYTIPANISNNAVLLCTLTLHDIVIDLSTLPDGYILNIKKLDNTVHLVKLNVTLDGDANPSIKSQYESLAILKSSGTYYLI